MQCFLCQAQVSSDSVARAIEDKVYAIYENHFYTQPDSAFWYLEELADQAKRYQLWDVQIATLLQAAWCADYHTRIDTLQYYLNGTELLLRQHTEALDTLDPNGTLNTDVAYTRGSFYYTTGDYQAAIDAFKNIVAPQTLSPEVDSLLVVDVFVYLGNAYYQLQNYQASLSHFRIATNWLPKFTDSPDYDRAYREALHALYQAQSYYATAHYNAKREAYEDGESSIRTALTYFLPQKSNPRYRNPIRSGANMMADIFYDQQQYDSALHYLSIAVSVAPEASTLLIDTYNKIGNTYMLMQRHADAQLAYEKSLELADQLLPSKHVLRASTYLHQGRSLARQGLWKEALTKYQEALTQLVTEFNATANVLENPLYQDAGAKKELLEVLSYKALALWELYQQAPNDDAPLVSALEIYHQIGIVLDQMREGFPSVEFKQFVAAHFFGIFERAIRVAYELHHIYPDTNRFLSEAFHFAEKSKSFILLEATQEVQAQSFGGLPDSLLEQERAFTRKLSLLKQQIVDLPDSSGDQHSLLQQELLATKSARQSLLDQFEQDYPNYYALRHDTEVASLSEVQSRLPANTVLLSYFYGDSSLFTFAISTERIAIDTISDLKNIENKIGQLLTFTRSYNWEEAKDTEAKLRWTKQGHSVYQQLVGNLLDSLEADPEKLIIIPDGQLGYLPFDILLTQPISDAAQVQFSTLPYLIKQLPLRYEYSASLYIRQEQHYNTISTQYAYTGFAPVYEGVSLLAENELTRSGTSDVNFNDLLHNKDEVRQAAKLFDSQVFLNERATEQAFREFAPQSNLLHLSMHAFAHDEDPMYSGLVFSQTDTATEDNFLFAHELYSIPLRANLAVLSACETGVGQLARGEGIMSLGRAFKYAGCPNIAMSLWKVNDQTTQKIIQVFFEQLANGMDKDIALQQAKLSFLTEAKGPLAHPYYWASLVLIGDDQPLAKPSTPDLYLLFIILTMLILLGALVLIVKKRRNTFFDKSAQKK